MTRLPLHFAPLRELADRSADEYAADDTHGAIRVYARIQFTRLLSDLTRPESQAAWLRWLAGRVGVSVPAVGAPVWRNSSYPVEPAYLLGLNRHPDDHHGTWFHYNGRFLARRAIQCPALPNPDSADASIRALVLAVLTVGGGR